MADRPVAEPAQRRGLLARATRFVVVIALVALIAAPFVTAFAVVSVSREDVRRVSDAIVVLGAAQDDGTPREILSSRLDHAAQLYRDGVADQIITVGGKAPGDRFTEAQAGRNYLIEQGIPASAIAAVGEGRDTLTSLQAGAELMDERDWCTAVLVSDPWHMLRSRTMAQDLGVDAVTSPTRTGPTNQPSRALRYIVRETAAQLAYLGLERRDVDTVVRGCG